MRVARTAVCLCEAACIALSACGGGAGMPPAEGGGASLTAPSDGSNPGPTTPFRPGLGGRVLVGYQGWFGCPGDYDGATGWRHWFAGIASFAALTVDTFPDTSTYPVADLCDTGLARSDGSHLMVFSSQNEDVVQHHFALMAATGIGGVAFQRFVTDLQDPALKRRADHVLSLVRASALRANVPFFVTYDVTGGGASAVDTVRSDWRDLHDNHALTSDSAYLTDSGKPVLEIWGLGFSGHPGTPSEAAALLSDLRTGANGLAPATTIGGVPTNWRTLDGDAQSDPAWAAVYRQFDVLSPWMVGRVRDEASTADIYASRINDDLQALSGTPIRYLPVIFPGFSSNNLMQYDRNPAAAKLNEIPRQCGRLLWAQANAALSTGSSDIYLAMFDEFDEGTAVLPIVDRAGIPSGVWGVGRDADGCELPPDWYLTLVRGLSAGLVGGKMSLGAMPSPS
jgi:hypothetical protein